MNRSVLMSLLKLLAVLYHFGAIVMKQSKV